jgi:hypothetical protein
MGPEPHPAVTESGFWQAVDEYQLQEEEPVP